MGAELVLFFGVDGEAQKLAQNGVRNGQVLELNRSLSVDPGAGRRALVLRRGEGSGYLFRLAEDPMPWAVTFLPRTTLARNAPFRAGQQTLRAADNRGNAFTLSFEVLA